MSAGLRNLLAAGAVPLALLVLWQAAVSANAVSPLVLPPPADVLTALRDLVADGTLAAGLGISLRRAAIGFAAGASIGIGLGAVMGLSAAAQAALRSTLMALLNVPALAWIPLLMIPLGIGETLKYAAISIAAFSATLLHTSRALRQVSPSLIEVGTIYRLNWPQRLLHILLPAAFPGIFTGLRLGLTQAWQSLVVVELVASTDGIGYLSVWARQMFRLDQMFAVMIVIGLVGFGLDRLLHAAESRLARQWGAA